MIVGVLFGSRSVEHEVSIITAHQGMSALAAAGYDVLPIYITKKGHWYAGTRLNDIELYTDLDRDFSSLHGVYRVSLTPDPGIKALVHHPMGRSGWLKRPPALWADIFFPMVHGPLGEDGTLAGLLELAGVPFVGSGVHAAAISMNKLTTKEIARSVGIPTLEGLHVRNREDSLAVQEACGLALRKFNFPVMVKPVHLGSSIGVSRCSDEKGFVEAVSAAFLLDSDVLVEKALVDFAELNCSVLGGNPNRVSAIEQPISSSKLLTFDDKYKRGRKSAKAATTSGMASLERIVPAEIDETIAEAIRNYSLQLFEAIGASGVVRIDFLYDRALSQLYFNEINTLPGSLAFYLWEASGLQFDELMETLIKDALREHSVKLRRVSTFESNLLAPPEVDSKIEVRRI